MGGIRHIGSRNRCLKDSGRQECTRCVGPGRDEPRFGRDTSRHESHHSRARNTVGELSRWDVQTRDPAIDSDPEDHATYRSIPLIGRHDLPSRRAAATAGVAAGGGGPAACRPGSHVQPATNGRGTLPKRVRGSARVRPVPFNARRFRAALRSRGRPGARQSRSDRSDGRQKSSRHRTHPR